MTVRAYTVLGWAVWKIAGRVVRRKVEENRTKLIAGGVVAAVVVAGLIAGGLAGGGDDE